MRPQSSPCVMDIATHRHPGSVPHLTAHPGMAHPPFPIVDKQAQATKTLRRLKNSVTTCSPANLMAFRGHNTSGSKRRSFGKLMQMGLKIFTFPAPSRRRCCKSQDFYVHRTHTHTGARALPTRVPVVCRSANTRAQLRPGYSLWWDSLGHFTISLCFSGGLGTWEVPGGCKPTLAPTPELRHCRPQPPAKG